MNDEKIKQPKEQPNEPVKTEAPEKPKKNYNLVFLGIGATVLAFLTTFISLKLYHDSGDIYLDRSRPGFLPEKEEVEQSEQEKSDYAFPSTGTITPEVMDEFLENLKAEVNRLNDFPVEAFDPNSLSDDTLGF